ncbi:hypothetical protein [uncultured Dialister sp.]|uniref:hypothetical protein n=1 Tax=uncultured Dialister sp. TaxID=278064 RepID=UPI0027DB10C0|nr:hypothetical protein [uncultured Dialister sp.]
MRKFLLALGMATLLAMPTSFAYRFYAEPESDTAVSYDVYDVLDGKWETTFVNYANADGSNEYWLRVASRYDQTKLLHFLTITVDGESCRLTAIPLDSKHYYTGSSAITTQGDMGHNMHYASQSRYFPISADLAAKLAQAKEIIITYNTNLQINCDIRVNKDVIENLKKSLPLKYADFNNYWKPEDKRLKLQQMGKDF